MIPYFKNNDDNDNKQQLSPSGYVSEDNSGKGNIFPTRQQAYVKPGGTVEGLGGGAGAAPRGGGGGGGLGLVFGVGGGGGLWLKFDGTWGGGGVVGAAVLAAHLCWRSPGIPALRRRCPLLTLLSLSLYPPPLGPTQKSRAKGLGVIGGIVALLAVGAVAVSRSSGPESLSSLAAGQAGNGTLTEIAARLEKSL